MCTPVQRSREYGLASSDHSQASPDQWIEPSLETTHYELFWLIRDAVGVSHFALLGHRRRLLRRQRRSRSRSVPEAAVLIRFHTNTLLFDWIPVIMRYDMNENHSLEILKHAHLFLGGYPTSVHPHARKGTFVVREGL